MRGSVAVVCAVVLAQALGTSGGGAFASAQGTPGAQAPADLPRGTGFILGQVVDTSGDGVSGVVVSLGGAITQVGGFTFTPAPLPGGPRRTLTNSDGRFVFPDLPAGRYSLDASKAGYLPGAFGRRRPNGNPQTLTLGDGERHGSVKVIVFQYGAITGTVTDESGEPVVSATVRALRRIYESGHARFANAATATTDDRGVYRLAALAQGEYLVSLPMTHGTAPVALAEAYQQAQLNGTTQDFVRQLGGAFTAMQAVTTAGQRLGDLLWTPGFNRAVVGPSPGEDGRLLVYPTSFYPGTALLSRAELISIAPGDDRRSVDLRIALIPTGQVTGTVTGPDGPAANLALRLVPEYAGDLSAEQTFDVATSVTDARGAFTFLAVPYGQYTIRALKVPPNPAVPNRAGGPSAPRVPAEQTYWANVPVTVGAGPHPEVQVTLAGGFRIAGRFVFDGVSPKPPPEVVQTFNLVIQPIDGKVTGAVPLTGIVNGAGEISTYALPPGRYVIRMSMPTPSWLRVPDWHYVSSVLDGRDVGEVPLDLQRDVSGLVVTMSDRYSLISGVATDPQGRADPDAAVLIYSADRGSWANFGQTPRRLRYVRVAADGSYRVTALPAGEYFVAAIPDEQSEDWMNPRVLEAIGRGADRLRLADAERKTHNVVTRRMR